MNKFQVFAFLGFIILYTVYCSTETPYLVDGELKQWHTITLTFDGPELDEQAEDNPFLDYRLLVRFRKGDKQFDVPGYFAADGNAGETSASAGNKWKVHFTPEEVGEWAFEVFFQKGKDLAIQSLSVSGESLKAHGQTGSLQIAASDKTGSDFRAKGRIDLSANGRFMQFAGTKDFFLKGGADSPENFLAFHEFDGTFRQKAEARKGEADPKEGIHKYEAHLKDWKEGDPTWQGGKGKAIIGALNYLASKGMNSVYFLTMNINGDGKDVWPYTGYDERSRFDCSKLDQWEVVFQHMEQSGILMHLVIQETENEKLLDDGDTGPQRKLYFRELVARFGHHLGLIWNLGEENGPAEFSPNGQNSQQQKAMATYLKNLDPYKHPVVIHTHSWKGHKDELLPALLGHPELDGLSFQIDKREQVHEEVIKWSALAQEAGRPWVIQMDEIGMWHTGVMPDAINPDHDTIRHEVLWGSLMAGAAGVEWYFGARYDHNDLTCEDWRSRANIWDQTRYALDFFNTYLPFSEMTNKNELVNSDQAYCLAKAGQTYAIYLPSAAIAVSLNLEQENPFSIDWYNPRTGGKLEKGTKDSIKGKGLQELGLPPNTLEKDWVALVRSN